MIAKKDLSVCSVETTVSLIGNKWKLLILRDIFNGPKRFGELKKTLEGFSQKVLTESLRSMEEDGIVNRKVFAQVPPKVEYNLSEIEEAIRLLISSMENFGIEYKKNIEVV